MKSLYWKIITLIILLGLGISIIVFLSRIDSSSAFEKITFSQTDGTVDIITCIISDSSNINQISLSEKIYLLHDNWKSITILNSDLEKLDSINKDHLANTLAVVNALTINNRLLATDNLDSVNAIMKWAEKLDIASEVFPNNRLCFKAISSYWRSETSKRIQKLVTQNEDLKYSFKVRYLREQGMQSNFGTAIGNSNFIKIIDYIVDGKWKYVIVDRLWKSTTIGFKVVLALLILLTFTSYLCMIKQLIKKVRR